MRFEQTAQWKKALKRAQEWGIDPELVERKLTRNGVARHYLVYSPRSERSHPVLLARTAWDRVPDEGARRLPATLVECADLTSPGDVDLPGDLPPSLRP